MPDRTALRRLVDAYAVAMDDCDLDALAEQFLPTGELVVLSPGRERPLAVLTGPGEDGIGAIPLAMRDAYDHTLHNVTTHLASPEGDRAGGVTYCVAHHVPAEGDVEVLAVRYRESFVRGEDGWRFARREVTRLWSGTTPAGREPLLVDRAVAARLA
jgi:SnoaL-like domain